MIFDRSSPPPAFLDPTGLRLLGSLLRPPQTDSFEVRVQIWVAGGSASTIGLLVWLCVVCSFRRKHSALNREISQAQKGVDEVPLEEPGLLVTDTYVSL